MRIFGSLAAVLAFSTLAVAQPKTAAKPVAAPAQPPESEKRPVTDTYHGVKVVDDYRWLEDWANIKVREWSEAQNAYARGVLDKLPHVEDVRARVTEVMSAQTVSYYGLQHAGGRVFAMKRQPPLQQPLLVVMDSAAKPDQAKLVADPNEMNKTGVMAIDWYVPSPDGKTVAISLSKGGSETGDVHLFDVATHKPLFEVVPHAQNGTAGGSLAWSPDGKGFWYTRYPRGKERPKEDQEFYMQVYYHAKGTPTEQDQYELGHDFPKIAEIILDSNEAGVVLASMQKGDGGEFQHYVRTLDKQWTQLDTYEDRAVQAVLGKSKDGKTPIYFVSRKEAARGKLLKLEVQDAKGSA